MPKEPSKTANLHHTLVIVIGMTYDLIVNVCTKDGLSNGATCAVKYIEYRKVDTNRPSIIWVQCNDIDIETERRLEYRNKGFYNNHVDDSWTPIFDIERTFNYGQTRTLSTIQGTQFPLQPAAGRSVHRAQGSTLDRAVIDLSQKHPKKIAHLHQLHLAESDQ